MDDCSYLLSHFQYSKDRVGVHYIGNCYLPYNNGRQTYNNNTTLKAAQ